MVRAGYREAALRSAHIIADSEHTSSDIQKILGVPDERITAIHLAAAGEHFHACSEAGELQKLQNKFGLSLPYILAASASNWRTKNLESALRVAQTARDQADFEFCTVVYGPPEGITALGPNQSRKKLSMIRAGYVSKSDLGALFRHAHAFLMPSLYEGFGLPLVEAMSCGCPVIASNCGSLPEVAGDGAQCFDPCDIQAMANALAALLCSPEELKRRRAKALKRAADFSWDKAARATLSVYHHVNQ